MMQLLLWSLRDTRRQCSHCNKGFEPGPLSGSRLLLHRHDLENLVFEYTPSQKVINDLCLLDGDGEEINVLQMSDFTVLHKTSQLGHRDPLQEVRFKVNRIHTYMYSTVCNVKHLFLGSTFFKWQLFIRFQVEPLVSQATPFAERGRVWSRCNYRVVAEERNY